MAYTNVNCEDIYPLDKDGFVVSGWSGHNMFDEFRGMLQAFDNAGVRTYQYSLFNLVSPGYDLQVPGQRAVTRVKAVKLLSNGNLGICGYISDHDAMGLAATYKYGFYCEFDKSGVVPGNSDRKSTRLNSSHVSE